MQDRSSRFIWAILVSSLLPWGFVAGGVVTGGILAGIVAAGSGTGQSQHPEHAWDYSQERGPAHWADLNPEFAACKLGHEQSPVDISNPKPADLPPIQFDYKPSPLRIIDNGHTLMIKYASGSSISMMERTYALQQFHFHKPSESKIDGKAYDMELHLVHADEKGELVVVAVLMRQGPDNGTMHKVLDHVPGEKEKEESPQGIEVDASALLPADKSYYVFMGSLTTPPCTEHVTWLVLKQPITVSAAQIEQFSKLYPNNARPTQPLYDRVVHASK